VLPIGCSGLARDVRWQESDLSGAARRGKGTVRYLVTGGAGFIGSHIVDHLVAAGHDVVVLDDCSSGARANLAAVADRIRFIEDSICDFRACVAATRGVHYVLHQAALTSVIGSIEDPAATDRVNVGGTMNVLIAAREAGVRRVVLAASTAAYGDSTELPNRETMLPRPLSPYAASKLAAEAYCQAFRSSYGLETVMLRYFNVFGPRQDPASPYAAAIPRFIIAALRGESPVIYGDGEQTRDFTFVANVARANLLACTAPAARVAGEVFNVGSGCSVTINEVWSRIRQALDVPLDARRAPGRPGEVRDSRASIEKAAAAMGYRPHVDFPTGLRLTVAFYAHQAAMAVRPSRVPAATLSA
jgi:UDP-N-acetylglucosamine/UDP-N-acetyl-alpha-D-glucosaminouronate 4-epimerase